MKQLIRVLLRFRFPVLALWLTGAPTLSVSAVAQDRLAALVGDGSVMLRSPGGEALVSVNPDALLVPASVVKIPMTQVALSMLGDDFRFETRFYTNDSGDLLIRGLGDPFLVSEEIARVAEALALLGLEKVQRLVVDDSAFAEVLDLPVEASTDQPYGARNGALAVNFNTVNLAWSAHGELISAEEQTPLTPLAKILGAKLSPGQPQRINLGEDPLAGLQQVQQLFRLFLEDAGIEVSDQSFYRETVTEEWTLFYQHFGSRSLADILQGLLRYSNNFIANQLFLTLGGQHGGYPATTDSARAALQGKLTELYGEGFGTNPQQLMMIEGSGLSRKQRTSGAGMMRILEVFKPYAHLLPQADGVLGKTGTLTGVYNLAGYIQGSEGLFPFVILTNQAANNRAEILRLLQQRVQ